MKPPFRKIHTFGMVVSIFSKKETMEATAPQYGLSNLQLELLKLNSRNTPEEDLLAIKSLIVKYMSQKASKMAVEIMEQKGLDIDTILKTHIRTPYKR